MSWIPATDVDRQAMLAAIGVQSMEELFAAIPPSLRMQSWNLPEGKSEMAVQSALGRLSARNDVCSTSFLGGGYYDHYIPAAVDYLTGRSEFYTAYTPYQPECSQGTLQAIYEYQTSICRLTGMDFTNASLYDGGTALFEAATMSLRITRRTRVVVHDSVNPTYRLMLETHAANLDVELVSGDDPADAACVIVQNPSFLGTVHDFTELGLRCHAAGALLVVSCYPLSLGLLKSPGEMGADIAIADGQSLGLPLGFGGPYLGILATRKEHVRQNAGPHRRHDGGQTRTPGFRAHIAGARAAHPPREGDVQHLFQPGPVRLARAGVSFLSWASTGCKRWAAACHAKAEYLKSKLSFAQLLNNGPTFNEFAVRLPRNARTVAAALLKRGFLAGLPPVGNGRGQRRMICSLQ